MIRKWEKTAYKKRALHIDFKIFETSGIHYTANVIGLILEDDLAALTTVCKSLYDGWC